MELKFEEYKTRKIVNVHKHIDSWFWDKYSAMPYVGCRSGCEFCYCRGGRYSGGRNPETFDTLIRVKINAAELLRKELSRMEPDIIACGDWQVPAENRYRLSRAMLKVILDLGFPLFIIERSSLVTEDMDILVEINKKTWVGIVFSMSNVDPDLKKVFEPRSPGLKLRLNAMEKFAKNGILVGTALMPIIPFIGDDEKHLGDAIRATKDHGGSFVLSGGLTMEGVQAQRTLKAACQLDPKLESLWRKLYNWEKDGKPEYSPPNDYSAKLSLMVRKLCIRYDLKDRMPRYVLPGPLAINKRIAEHLFLRVYELELEQAANTRIWAYRKTAWTVDKWQESIAELYHEKGENGLKELPGIGTRLARRIANWICFQGLS